MTHQQYLNIKKILLNEYVSMGYEHPTEFLRGMTWFEQIVTNKDISVPMYEDLPSHKKIVYLEKRLNDMIRIVNELEEKNLKLEKNLREYKRLTKKERSELRKNTYVKDLINDRNRAIQHVLDIKQIHPNGG